MKQILKNEFERMFFSLQFLVVVLIGCGIALWFFYQNIIERMVYIPNQPRSAYISWMGTHTFWMQSFWFFLIFPLLAVLSFAGSFYEDKKNGYIKQSLLRTSKKDYFLAKGITVFLSGSLSVTIPLIFSFVLTATKLPLLYPEEYFGYGPMALSLDKFFYLHPMVYIIVYLIFDFIMGGIIALLAMILTYWIPVKYLGLLLPFIALYGLYMLSNFLGTDNFSINFMLIPEMGIHSIVSVIFIGVIVVGTILSFIWSAYRYEEV